MPKELSCGFILFARETGEILGCHPTGHAIEDSMSYDIPKGHIEPGEEPLDAAKRELREETGLVIPPDAPIHEIGHVPYQSKKALHLFSASLPKRMLSTDKLKCESMFDDVHGNRKREVDSYILTTNPDMFFKNLQPYVRIEANRVSMHEPMCVVYGTNSETGTKVAMTVRGAGIMIKSYRDTLVKLKDDNVYPNGYSADVELSDGSIVSVELDDVQEALVDNVAVVDIDGSIAGACPFPIEQWFEQALDVDTY